jgi:hypothetical protein
MDISHIPLSRNWPWPRIHHPAGVPEGRRTTQFMSGLYMRRQIHRARTDWPVDTAELIPKTSECHIFQAIRKSTLELVAVAHRNCL